MRVVASLLIVCTCFGNGQAPNVLWRDPGAVEELDLSVAVGVPAPEPPFVFSEEEGGGRAPKILVTDAQKRTWSVKFGPEVKAEVFATRMLESVGYLADKSYFVAGGKIDSVGALGRAASQIHRGSDNRFEPARFELREQGVHPLSDNWSFVHNPFLGTHEFQGLKIMMMLLSNWDVKDNRSADGPNTLVLGVQKDGREVERRYLIGDWGAAMGKTGNIATRSKWDCTGYTDQTKSFVKGIQHGKVGFSFDGKHREDIANGITVEDVRWLMQYLGRITDDQIRAALKASGASESETACFARAVRDRIEQLRRLTNEPSASLRGDLLHRIDDRSRSNPHNPQSRSHLVSVCAG